MGIREMILWALAKLVMRVAGEQAKTSCGDLQLCAGPNFSIKGETHTVGERRRGGYIKGR